MAENQEELKLEIGTEEAISLKPAKVKILNVKIEEVGEKKSRKVICECRHPDSPEVIHISSVKYENKGKLETAGLWLNKDSKGLLRKGSALAVFLTAYSAKTIEELKDKEIPTIQDEKGYLCFKAY